MTIQAGVDAVDSGGMVIVRAGTFAANISIANNLILVGDGADVTFIDGGGTTPGLTIEVGASVEVRDLTVQYAVNTLYGGGIRNLGTLILEDCVIQNNTATAGGGIFSDQAISIRRCVIQGNSATDSPGGGGLFIESPMAMIDVSIRDNHAYAWGAGGGGMLLNNGAGEAVTVRRTTVNANTAPVSGEFTGGGAGIFLAGNELAYFANVTVTDNSSGYSEAGVKAFNTGAGYCLVRSTPS